MNLLVTLCGNSGSASAVYRGYVLSYEAEIMTSNRPLEDLGQLLTTRPP